MQKQYLETCENAFIKFLSECIANILNGNVRIRKNDLFKFQNEMDHLKKKSLSPTVRREIFTSPRGLLLLSIISDPIQQHFKK